MYYKITKESKLYDPLKSLFMKAKEYRQIALDFAKKKGWDIVFNSSRVLGGGIYGVAFDEKPDDWRKVGFSCGYKIFYPKKLKKNRDILKEIEQLPKVEIHELNDLLDFGLLQLGPGGIAIHHPAIYEGVDCFLIEVPHWCKWRPDDSIEITGSELDRLKLTSKSKAKA